MDEDRLDEEEIIRDYDDITITITITITTTTTTTTVTTMTVVRDENSLLHTQTLPTTRK